MNSSSNQFYLPTVILSMFLWHNISVIYKPAQTENRMFHDFDFHCLCSTNIFSIKFCFYLITLLHFVVLETAITILFLLFNIYKLQKLQPQMTLAIPHRLTQINVLQPTRNVEMIRDRINVCVKPPTIQMEPLVQSVRLGKLTLFCNQ